MKVKSSLLRTWLCHSMLVVSDLGMDLVEVGVSRVLPSRDLDRDKPLFREVVPQDVGRIRETLQNKNGNTYGYSFHFPRKSAFTYFQEASYSKKSI